MIDKENQKSGFDQMTGHRELAGPEDQRLQKAKELMTPADFEYFKKTIESKKEGVQELFDLRGKVLHTTNSFYFEKILQQGRLRTEGKKDGLYGTAGASFTNGYFEKAATFQTLMDDQNTRSADKQFNTQPYSDKISEFIKYFWDKDAAAITEYLQRISGKRVDSFEQAVAAAETFKYQATPSEIRDNPDELAKLFGVTIAFDKNKLPELTVQGTEGPQQQFELRSYRPDGVPLSEASTVFVPETQIGAIRKKLQEHGLAHIDIRPSEELEVIRMNGILYNQ